MQIVSGSLRKQPLQVKLTECMSGQPYNVRFKAIPMIHLLKFCIADHKKAFNF